jgi:hypothetical protein
MQIFPYIFTCTFYDIHLHSQAYYIYSIFILPVHFLISMYIVLVTHITYLIAISCYLPDSRHIIPMLTYLIHTTYIYRYLYTYHTFHRLTRSTLIHLLPGLPIGIIPIRRTAIHYIAKLSTHYTFP